VEEEQGEEGPGQADAREDGTGPETEDTVSTRISTFWGAKRWWEQHAPERPRREEGSVI